MYIDKLDDIVNQHNNTYHSTIKINIIFVRVKDDIYIYIIYMYVCIYIYIYIDGF